MRRMVLLKSHLKTQQQRQAAQSPPHHHHQRRHSVTLPLVVDSYDLFTQLDDSARRRSGSFNLEQAMRQRNSEHNKAKSPMNSSRQSLTNELHMMDAGRNNGWPADPALSRNIVRDQPLEPAQQLERERTNFLVVSVIIALIVAVTGIVSLWLRPFLGDHL